MKTPPTISVIMSIYNQFNREYLQDAIMSVLGQTFTDFEFIIYNDGSDESVCLHLETYAKMDPRIVVINNPKNHGLAYSLNTCIDVAKGKYLARMDDDDICEPNRFQVQVDYLNAHPEIAFVGCNAKLIDKNGVWGHRTMPENPTKNSFLRFSPYIHPTVMIRRNIFDKQAAYRSSKETWRCEDYELFMRLAQLGYRGHNIQEELFCYREDNVSYKKRKLKYRIDEMRLRYRNFQSMGILYPLGWPYVIRPLVAGIIPSPVILGAKKCYHLIGRIRGKRVGEEITTIQTNTEERLDMEQSLRKII